MAKNSVSTQAKITNVDVTTEKVSGRGGMFFFLRYVENIIFYPLFEKSFGFLRASAKWLPIYQFIKQLLAHFIDGTDMSMSSFDRRKGDESYAAILENVPEQMASSHQIKRAFSKLAYVGNRVYRRLLHQLFTKSRRFFTPLQYKLYEQMCLVRKKLYCYCAGRQAFSEALNLTWEDVDLDEHKVITIRESKSGESWIIPVNGTLFKTLSGLERNGCAVFEFSPYFVTHKFKDYLKSANIKGWKSLSLHNLRHTFASHLVMAGKDLYTVGKLLGHSSVAVTQMYAHLAPDYLRVSIESLEY